MPEANQPGKGNMHSDLAKLARLEAAERTRTERAGLSEQESHNVRETDCRPEVFRALCEQPQAIYLSTQQERDFLKSGDKFTVLAALRKRKLTVGETVILVGSAFNIRTTVISAEPTPNKNDKYGFTTIVLRKPKS